MRHKLEPHQRKALRALRKLCAETGATLTIEEGSGVSEARLEAPKGHRWGGDLHEYVDAAFLPWRNDFADMLDRAQSEPAMPCDDPECEWCRPKPEEGD